MADLFPDAEIPEDALERMGDAEIHAAWPAALVSMVAVVEAEHRRAGMGDDDARSAALRAIRALSSYHGGRMWYLPKGESMDRALRDREIWERFNGKNVPQLVRAYRLTEVQIYKILREQRALDTHRRQHQMFPED